MRRVALTDLAIQKLKPPVSGQVEVFDSKAPGLSIRVGANGVKTFYLTYRVKGIRKRRRGTLGRYEIMSLSEARAVRLDKLALASKGIDPFHRARSNVPNAGSWRFEDCLERFVSEYLEHFNKRPREGERILRKHFLKEWRGRDVREIEWSDVKTFLQEIGEKGGSRASNAAFSRLRKFFNWLRKNADRADAMPVSPLFDRSPLFPENAPRERVLRTTELVALWCAADELEYPYAHIFKLLTLLGQRRSEVAGMRWEDIDFREETWALAGRSTKNKQPHVMPLPRRAIEIIKSCPRVDGSPFVFPSAHCAQKHLTGFSVMKAALDRASGVENWTLHDLRRTQATILPDLDISETIVERLHNHKLPGTRLSTSASIYNRYKYVRQMRDALEIYADHLEKMIDSAQAPLSVTASLS